MSNLDYEISQVHTKGSVLPWLLLTVVVAVAAVGMFAFNMQKDQAMIAMDKYKQETDALKKRQGPLEQQVEDANRQLAAMKTDRDDMEHKLNDANQKVTELTEQLKVTKAEAVPASKSKHKSSRSRRRR